MYDELAAEDVAVDETLDDENIVTSGERPIHQKGHAIPKEERSTTRFMTKYERARLLGTRALQISYGFLLRIPTQQRV